MHFCIFFIVSWSIIWYTFSILYLFSQHFEIINLLYFTKGASSLSSMNPMIHPSVSVYIWWNILRIFSRMLQLTGLTVSSLGGNWTEFSSCIVTLYSYSIEIASPETVTVFWIRQYYMIYWASSEAEGRSLGFGVKHFVIRLSKNYEYWVDSGRKKWVLIEDKRL